MADNRKTSGNSNITMEQVEKNIQATRHLKGLAAHILEEVIKADMSMHAAQVDAWIKFAENRPYGRLINKDIHMGFSEKRYLCLNEARLSFSIKSLPQNFFQRAKLAFKVLIRKNSFAIDNPVVFDICSKDQKDAIAMEILVKRFENGAIQANYKAVDSTTSNLLKKVNS